MKGFSGQKDMLKRLLHTLHLIYFTQIPPLLPLVAKNRWQKFVTVGYMDVSIWTQAQNKQLDIHLISFPKYTKNTKTLIISLNSLFTESLITENFFFLINN